MALVVAALLGSGLKNVVIAIGIALIPGYARLMCAQVLTVKENDYVSAARAIGANNRGICCDTLSPTASHPLSC